MFKIAKKNLILVKIYPFLKNNVTSLGRLPSFLDFFGLLLRIFIKILILRKI